MGLTAALIGVGIGLLLLSRLLIKPSAGKGDRGEFDDSIATFAARNEPIPVIIGKRRTGAIVISVWGRETKQEKTASVEGGKGGGGGGGDIKQTVYFENAVHAVAVGPLTKLHAIYQNGEIIWESDSPLGTGPSGADQTLSVDLGNEGAFTFHFGHSSAVTKAMFRESGTGEPVTQGKQPFLAMCEWTRKRLGGSPDWPQLEYLVEMFSPSEAINGSSYELVPPGGDADLDRGINFAHIIWEILTGQFPWGAGLYTEDIDAGTLQAFGAICEAEGLCGNLLIKGETVSDVLQDIMSVCGLFITTHRGKLYFMPIREETTDIPVFDDDFLLTPEAEVDVDMGELKPNRVILSFPSHEQSYRNDGLTVDDDGAASRYLNYRNVEIRTNVVTSRYVMDIVARRKLQEAFGDRQTQRVTVLRGATLLIPGNVVEIPELGVVRVSSMKRDTSSQSAVMEVIIDSFGIGDTSEGSDPPPSGGGGKAAAADLHVNWFELPYEDSPEVIAIVVLRIRAHSQINGANVHVSYDDISYQQSGQQGVPAAGGQIASQINTTDGPDIIENGPVFTAANIDAAGILDLSVDTAGWTQGRQVAMINDEVFFLRNVDIVAENIWQPSTAYSVGQHVVPPSGAATGLRYVCVSPGTSGADAPIYWPTDPSGSGIDDGDDGLQWKAAFFRYQLRGLIRARKGSVAATHASGSWVSIIESSNLTVQRSSLFTVNTTLYVKTQPFTTTQTVDLATVTPVSKLLTGKAVTDTVLGLGSGVTLVTHLGAQIKLED
jgi:hypothetical protein